MRCPLCEEAQMKRHSVTERRTCPKCGFELSKGGAEREQERAYDDWRTRGPPDEDYGLEDE